MALLKANTGIGITDPSEALHVIGNGLFEGIVSATSFTGNLSGTATSAINLVGGQQGSVPYQSSTNSTTFLSPGSSGQVLLTGGSGENPYWAPVSSAAGSFGGITIQDEGDVVGSALSISSLNFVGSNITATGSGIAATITISNNLVGTALSISGISTFTNGPVLIGSGTSTGTTAQPLQVTGGAYVSGNLGIGTTTPTSKLQIVGDVLVSGVVTATTFDGSFTGSITGNATSADKLFTPRTISLTGDIEGSVSFDGSTDVSIASTIQPNSVGLGTDTFGDYVKDITGTSNQITVTSGTGEGSTPTLSIPNQFTVPQDLTVIRDVQINRNLNVNGNITIGGTSATIFSQSLNVFDPDIVLGYRTDANGNDISTDNTANHGGVAIASTEGSPLVQLFIAGIETNPATYKKIMWFKAGTFAGLGTDAWLSNYAIGIGSTQFPTGTRLAAGSVQFTENDLAVVRNINASGIITATTFVGSFQGNVTTATYATNAGVATNLNGGASGSIPYQYSSGITSFLSGSSNNGWILTYDTATNAPIWSDPSSGVIVGTANYAINAGIATYATNAGIATYATNAGIATYAVVAGIATYATNAGIATYATNAGIATYAVVAGIATYATNAGIATYATNAGIATYATNAGIATYATNAGIATYATNAGIATYATNAGIATYATNAGIATYATNAGIATYAPNAGIATNVIGGIGSITQLQVTGISTFINGPVLIGSGTSTGTATQPLQVTGGAYVSGNLGIGTTNPSQSLHVQGNVRLTGALYDGNNTQGSSGQILSSTGSAVQWINASTTNVGSANSIAITADSTDASRYLTFVSTTSGNNLVYVDSDLLYNPSTNSLAINSTSFTGTASQNLQVTGGAYVSGNLGIGTINPSVKLQVGGTIGFNDSNIKIGNTNTGCSITSGTHNFFAGAGAGRCNTTGSYNNFFGLNAGPSNTTGTYNDFLGNSAGSSNTTGSRNFFVGRNAGAANTTGSSNVAIGYLSGESATGNQNVFIGGYSGRTGVTGSDNQFIGHGAGGSAVVTGSGNNFFGNLAGRLTTSGAHNNFLGYRVAFCNTTGSYNNFLGNYAGCANTTGSYNNFFGLLVGRNNTTGTHNNFLGRSAGCSNTTGSCNNFFGVNAGSANTTGINNNFFGSSAGTVNTSGSNNNFFGFFSGRCNTTACHNNFLGYYSGCNNTTGGCNNFFGHRAGLANTTGSHNNFLGLQAGASNTIGGCNIAIGYDAGYGNTSGSNNIFFGFRSGFNATGQSGCFNFFAGRYTGSSNTTGSCNVFIGPYAGRNNTTGSNNNLFGYLAGADGATNNNNNFFGSEAGRANISGSNNNFLGNTAGRLNTTGTHNNFLGYRAGFANTTGCYNNFFGSQAGNYNTIGSNNNFFGNAAGFCNTTGRHNNFLGRESGRSNTTGYYNNFFGYRAGYANTTGTANNFLGFYAGRSNTSGSSNNFLGNVSGQCNTTGSNNNFLGNYAGFCNTTGNHNNFFGPSAGRYNTTGSSNFIAGCESGRKNTTGSFNNFLGQCSGYCNTTGSCNNFFGSNAGFANTTGLSNNFFGSAAGYCNTTGSNNNFFGGSAGRSNTIGSDNNFLGRYSGCSNTTGVENTFLGTLSGFCNITGNDNIFLGAFSGISTANSSKVIVGTGFNSSNLFDAPDTTKDRQLAIGSRNSTSASQYWIVGDENFNVGIGTTNPSQKLHVQGNARITGALYDGSNLAGSSGQILQTTGSAVQWINPNTTNVGSANSIAITLDSTNASRYLTFVSTTSGNNVVYVDSDLLYNPSTNSLGINTTSFTGTTSQTLQVTGGAYVSGNLGIGTTNPGAKLQVTPTSTGIAGLFSGTTSSDMVRITQLGTGNAIVVEDETNPDSSPFVITGIGSVGVGTANPQYKLHVVGDFGATTKSFVIPHPTKPGMTLRHGSLEGAENGVYVRGKTTESIIPLPDYWTGLVDEESITVNLTARNDYHHRVVGISSNQVEIKAVGGEVDCYFMILGERKDVAKLVAEY